VLAIPPFSTWMSAVSSSLLSTQLEVAVARKQLDSLEQQGRDALTLIQSSAPPETKAPVNAAPGVGAQLNVVA
jgi:hypothetical protein